MRFHLEHFIMATVHEDEFDPAFVDEFAALFAQEVISACPFPRACPRCCHALCIRGKVIRQCNVRLTLQEEEEVRERETDKLVRIDNEWGLRGYDDTLIVNCCPGLRATHMRHMRHRLASMHALNTSVYRCLCAKRGENLDNGYLRFAASKESGTQANLHKCA